MVQCLGRFFGPFSSALKCRNIQKHMQEVLFFLLHPDDQLVDVLGVLLARHHSLAA